MSTRDPEGNILAEPYSEAVLALDHLIQKEVRVHYQNRTYRYQDLCLQWRNQGCPGTKHVQAIADLYQHGINITYPMLKIGSM